MNTVTIIICVYFIIGFTLGNITYYKGRKQFENSEEKLKHNWDWDTYENNYDINVLSALLTFFWIIVLIVYIIIRKIENNRKVFAVFLSKFHKFGENMIEYIKLQNYKSFPNTFLDLCNSKGQPKQFVLIYGENGSGKSTLLSTFITIKDFMLTMSLRNVMKSILENKSLSLKNNNFFKFLKFAMPKDTESIIKESKTVGSESNMILELGFNLKGKKGVYAQSKKYIININILIIFISSY